MLVVLVMSERREPVLALYPELQARYIATGTIFNAFGMARPGFEDVLPLELSVVITDHFQKYNISN